MWCRGTCGSTQQRLKPEADATSLVPQLPDSGTITGRPEPRLVGRVLKVRSVRACLVPRQIESKCASERCNSSQTEVYRYAHYKRESSTLYVFDLERWVYRITPTELKKVENGTDGVLFVKNSKWKSWTLLDKVPPHLDLAEALMGTLRFVETTLTRASIQFLLLVWLFSMFFRELFPTKVICAAIGAKGSGKPRSRC